MSFYQSLEDRYYALMEYIEQKLHIPVYKNFVTPIEKAGIPSFPIAILLLILILGAIFTSISVSISFGGPAQLTVTALSAGQPVPGAEVLVKWSDGSSTQSTDEKGNAFFSNLPAGRSATITVMKEGFKNATSRLVVGQVQTRRITLESLRIAVALTLQDNLGAHVNDANLFWSIEGGPSGNVQSDSEGVARFSAPPLQLISVSISKEGYESATLFVEKPEADYSQTVTLTKKNVIRFEQSPEASSVRVNVIDESGSAVENVGVRLLNNADDSVIQEGVAQYGSVEFANVPAATYAYVTVDAPGYIASSGAGKNFSKQVSGLTTFDVTLSSLSAGESGDTIIHTVDNNDQAVPDTDVLLFVSMGLLGGGEIDQFSFANRSTSDNNGNALFRNLPALYYFYGSASKPGYFPGVTLPFRGGESKNLTMEKETPNKTSELRITTLDFSNGSAVENASVSIYQLDGSILYYNKKTNSQGKINIKPLKRNTRVRVAASNGNLAGEATVNVTAAVNNLTLYLDLPLGKVNAVARDENGNALSGVEMTATQSGDTVDTCNTGSSDSCVLQIHANIPASITGNRSGYVPGGTITTVEPKGITTATLNLYSIAGICCTNTDTCGYDASLLDTPLKFVCLRQDPPKVYTNYLAGGFRKEVTTLVSGEEYVAELKISNLNTQTAGVYLETGPPSSGPNIAENSSVQITRIDFPTTQLGSTPVWAIRASGSAPSGNRSNFCGGSLQTRAGNSVSFNPPVKWVEVEFQTLQNGTVILPVTILVNPLKSGLITTTGVNLFYKAWGQNSNLYRRVPYDSAKGYNESLAGFGRASLANPTGEPSGEPQTNIPPSVSNINPTTATAGVSRSFSATITDGGDGVSCVGFYWGDGNSTVQSFSGGTATAGHNYATNGSKTLTVKSCNDLHSSDCQTSNAQAGCASASQAVTVSSQIQISCGGQGQPCCQTGPQCSGSLTCTGGVCVQVGGAACNIDGQQYNSNVRNPQNSCEACDPNSPSNWTTLPDGTSCAFQGLACSSTASCLNGACDAGTACTTGDGCNAKKNILHLNGSTGGVSCSTSPDFCIKFSFTQRNVTTIAPAFTAYKTTGLTCGDYGYVRYTLYPKNLSKSGPSELFTKIAGTWYQAIKFALGPFFGQSSFQNNDGHIALNIQQNKAKQDFVVVANFTSNYTQQPPIALNLTFPYTDAVQDVRNITVFDPPSTTNCPGPNCPCAYFYYRSIIGASQSNLYVPTNLGYKCLYLLGCETEPYLYRFDPPNCFTYNTALQRVEFNPIAPGCTPTSGNVSARAVMTAACSLNPTLNATLNITAWNTTISTPPSGTPTGALAGKCRAINPFCQSNYVCTNSDGTICGQGLTCQIPSCALQGTCKLLGARRKCYSGSGMNITVTGTSACGPTAPPASYCGSQSSVTEPCGYLLSGQIPIGIQ